MLKWKELSTRNAFSRGRSLYVADRIDPDERTLLASGLESLQLGEGWVWPNFSGYAGVAARCGKLMS